MQTTESTSTTPSYGSLFGKISSLHGKERAAFCKTLSAEEKKAYIQHLKEKDCEPVTGVFRCFEPLGGSLTMVGMAYPGEDPVKYEFTDGQPQTVPRYIARRLENEFQGCGTWYPTNRYLLDDAGKPLVNVGKKNRRFGFSSLDFQ